MARLSKQRFLSKNGVDFPIALISANDDEVPSTGDSKNSGSEGANSIETGGVKPSNATRKRILSNNLSLDKMKVEKRDGRAKRGRSKKQKQEQRSKAATRAPSEHLTFSPDDETRARMVKTLLRKPSNPERRKLEVNLTREFLRMYKRRRNEVQPDYMMLPQEKKHATAAATLCIHRRVTPSQLIDYWVEHVGDFTGMKFPALNFLAVVGNVDRVSVEVMVTRPGQKNKPKRRGGPEVHAYSGKLDERLARGLIAAKLLKSGELSDRFLMTIQTTAHAVSQGRHLFVSAKLKPLVQWAVDHLYGV